MPQIVLQSAAARMSTIETIQIWGRHIRQHNAKGTHKLYSIAVWRLKDFLPKKAKNITLEHFERFLASLDGLKPNTFNSYLTACKVFGSWLEEHDLPNPTKRLKKKRTLNIARCLTDEEYDKVLAVCNQQERDIVQFLCCSGLRQSEFLSLSATNIDPEGQFLHVIGKNRKPRSVPLNDVCRSIISRHPQMNLSKNETQLRRLCHRLAERAGVKQFTPHTFRHSFATRMLRAGVPISRISKILGHSSILITERIYVHWCQADLQGTTDVLDK